MEWNLILIIEKVPSILLTLPLQSKLQLLSLLKERKKLKNRRKNILSNPFKKY